MLSIETDGLNKKIITVVSGLPRSGTSMMMKMLDAGGVEILSDGFREADEDNPKGYYEFEKVKELGKDASWMGQAAGKAVKIISALLKHLPGEFSYRIIFMRRKMEEILKSQNQMLIRRGEPAGDVSDEEMEKLFNNHLQKVEDWLENQSNVEIKYIHYNEILNDPVPYCKDITRF
ncbi:MAG: sulfotransferase family protein, partial [Thermodesulfobacteriota bacterium]